ncbi:hypothetical protein FJT64_026607 [Amphibalanus amphitrite]|uniref:Uncharacterized protein n=1 Tax=Amphibalanus amphitrite TaxID=1232801 RepID=A0A6A4WBG3_AMPAM|nr:uncharacterized protein LOC122365585 [Amphibalanus amphitrite]KAF0301000.1 hypothetical protein FJT64_026607 [Amphibalanus amphitrite]
MSSAEGPRISVSGSAPARSPSRESLRTDTSLATVLSGEMVRLGLRMPGASRGPSPGPGARLRVPGGGPGRAPGTDAWCEDEADLLRSCGLLSRMLGMSKSFSTGDIARLEEPEPVRRAVSQAALLGLRTELAAGRLDQASRSCSTWVAVGDLASTSQLPSPQGRQQTAAGGAGQSPFSAADLIRAVNKKVRQNYIRRRLHITFNALNRLSQSEFNLEQLFSTGVLPPFGVPTVTTGDSSAGRPAEPPPPPTAVPAAKTAPRAAQPGAGAGAGAAAQPGVTFRDVDRQRGRPLTRYQRNMMVFNWLHTLDENSLEVT